MHKQANTPSEQPHWHSCSHYSQQGVFGWRCRMKNGKRNYCISSGWGLEAGGGWERVSGSPLPTTNSAKPSICAMTVWLLCSQFWCNLHAICCLPHRWAISNCVQFVHLFSIYLFVLCCLLPIQDRQWHQNLLATHKNNPQQHRMNKPQLWKTVMCMCVFSILQWACLFLPLEAHTIRWSNITRLCEGALQEMSSWNVST